MFMWGIIVYGLVLKMALLTIFLFFNCYYLSCVVQTLCSVSYPQAVEPNEKMKSHHNKIQAYIVFHSGLSDLCSRSFGAYLNWQNRVKRLQVNKKAETEKKKKYLRVKYQRLHIPLWYFVLCFHTTHFPMLIDDNENIVIVFFNNNKTEFGIGYQ